MTEIPIASPIASLSPRRNALFHCRRRWWWVAAAFVWCVSSAALSDAFVASGSGALSPFAAMPMAFRGSLSSPILGRNNGNGNGNGNRDCYEKYQFDSSWQRMSTVTLTRTRTRTRSRTERFVTTNHLPEVDERLREEDPIEFISQEVNAKMDANAIFNTGIIVVVALAVLSQLATVDVGIMRGWTLEERALRIPIDNWNSYSAVLSAAPIQTKAVTSATVYTIGDFIAQRTEGVSMGEVDRPRLLRSLLAGLIGHGPMSHYWYGFSETIFQDYLHLPPNALGTAVKILIDQTCWGPVWNNTYILMLGLMRFQSRETILGEMKRTTIPLIVSGLKLWPLAHCVTYGLVPVENRLLWVDAVEIVWVTILATAAAAVPGEGDVDGDGDGDDESTETTGVAKEP